MSTPRLIVRIEIPHMEINGWVKIATCQCELDGTDHNLEQVIELVDRAILGIGFSADSLKEWREGK